METGSDSHSDQGIASGIRARLFSEVLRRFSRHWLEHVKDVVVTAVVWLLGWVEVVPVLVVNRDSH